MKKFNIKHAATTSILTSVLLAPAAMAHADDYDTATTAGAGWAVFWLIFGLGIIAVWMALFVFWIVMLVDALQRKNWKDESQKNLWIILLIVSFFFSASGIVAIVYYFVVRKPLNKAGIDQAEVVSAPTATSTSVAGPKKTTKK